MKVHPRDASVMMGVAPTARLLRRVRGMQSVAAVKKLVIDEAVGVLSRLPHLPRRGCLSVDARGPNGIGLTVTADSGCVHIDFGMAVDDGWVRMYDLHVWPSGNVDEYGDFGHLVVMDDEYGKDWVESVKIE